MNLIHWRTLLITMIATVLAAFVSLACVCILFVMCLNDSISIRSVHQMNATWILRPKMSNRMCLIATCIRGGPWFGGIPIFCGGMCCGLNPGAFGPFGIIIRGGWPWGPWPGKLPPCIGPGCIGAWPRDGFVVGGIGRVFCWLSNWANAAFVGNVTIGFCPWSSFFGSRSKHMRILGSEPSVITQNPFDWPFARFSKNFTSWKSLMPIELTASVMSWSVVHWNCTQFSLSKTQNNTKNTIH